LRQNWRILPWRFEPRRQARCGPEFPGWSRADIIIAIDTLKKAGIVQGHRMSGFLLQNYDFLRSGLKFRGDGSLSFLFGADLS